MVGAGPVETWCCGRVGGKVFGTMQGRRKRRLNCPLCQPRLLFLYFRVHQRQPH